jgi:hypothetical protein
METLVTLLGFALILLIFGIVLHATRRKED